MARLRNMRHERFVREYLACDFNGAEAYRRVYPQRRPLEARFSASRLLTHGNVKRRIEEVQMALLKKADITVDRILNEYEEARLLAVAQAKPEAMGMLSEKKAKLVGLLIDRRETGNAGDFESLTDIGDILEKVRQEAGLEAAEALARAFQLTPLSSGYSSTSGNPEPSGEDVLEIIGTPPTNTVN